MTKDKSKNWFARHKILTTFGALIVLGIIISAANGSDPKKVNDQSSGSSSSSSSSAKAPEQTTFKAGDVISFDGKEVTVAAPERNWDSGNQFIVPDSGNEFLKVQVTITNKSKTVADYNVFDWKLQDSNGVIRDVDSAAFSVDGALNSGQLAPGGTISGFLVFQVKAGSTSLTLKYAPSFWSDKEVQISL